jgi:hypothetical protein
MRTWVKCLAGLALAAGLAPTVWGQFAPPGAPGAPPAPAPAPAPGAPPPNNLFAFLCPTPEQIQQCKDKCCKTQIGQLMNNGLKPIGALTGGLLGPMCPTSPFGDLLAAGTAEAARASRPTRLPPRPAGPRCATSPRWTVATGPKAATRLSARARRPQRVSAGKRRWRWAAAAAATRRFCALAIVVSGLEADGNPAEVSLRVKAAAAASLDRCPACVAPLPPPILPPVKEDKKEKPPRLRRTSGHTPQRCCDACDAAARGSPSLSYYHKLDKVSMSRWSAKDGWYCSTTAT